jgi:peptidoglycan/xylan/chitin deacetylase (PgdA/CDA1 family)
MRLLKRLTTWLVIFLALPIFLFFSLPLPGTIPVLMYHFLGPEDVAARESNFVTPKSFARQMAFLKKFNYHALTIDEYYAIKSGRRKSQGREILITFDDGHRTFKDYAFPVLKHHNIPATMFLISNSVENGGLPGYGDSMTIDEIKDLSNFPAISFQGHTRTHPHLREINDTQLKEELEDSKMKLETMLGKPVDYFAYPHGETDRKIMEAVKQAGYKLAFSTAFKKLEDIPEGPYTLTRDKISQSSDNLLVFWYHVAGLNHALKKFRQKIKYGL